MSLFQKSIFNSHKQDESLIASRWAAFQNFKSKIDAIRGFKEEVYQDGFFKDIFESCLGYTLKTTNPSDYNLEREKKNETDGKKADGVIYVGGEIIGVVELKDQKSKNLDAVEAQAFNYHASHSNSKYIIISNFDELRFYIDKKTAYEKFSLFNLTYEDFKTLHLLLSFESIRDNVPIKLKEKSSTFEQSISKELYRDFSAFRAHLFENIVHNNPDTDKQSLLRLTQKLCDRIVFILFAEDRGLLRPNMIREIRSRHENDVFGNPMYEFYKIYFRAINEGNAKLDIPRYNGGLFAHDPLLDSLIIDDEYLDMEAQKLSDFDFVSDISVNILGHIFEQSLTDLEEMNAQVHDEAFDRKKSKRKKDGVFYTPEYITRYIVENTLGKLCAEKKTALNLSELEMPDNPKKLTKSEKETLANLYAYRDWLLNLKILDPACGSGAFLNQALEFLIREHRNIDEYRRAYENEALSLYDIETNILEHNLYGVDINEDAVEIARLSLWLRTAQKGRALTNLSDKIKCGNSLIADKNVAENAFVWEEEFPEVFAHGGFDVVIGNPPYVNANELKKSLSESQYTYLKSNYQTAQGTVDLYIYFFELGLNILKKNCFLSYITPNRFLSASYGKALRELILEKYTITSLVDFSDKNVFEDASTYPVITTLQNLNQNEYTIFTGKTVNENIIFSRSFSSDKLNILTDSILGFLLNDKLTITEKIISNSMPLSVVGKINATSTAKEADDYSSLIIEDKNGIKIINTGTIDPYCSLWGINELVNQGSKLLKPYLKIDLNIISNNRIDLYQSKKIIISKIGLSCESFYDKNGEYASINTNCIHSFSDDFLPEYVLCWLNSRLFNYMFECFFDGLRMAGGYLLYSSPNLKNTYIKCIDIDQQKFFVPLSQAMTVLNENLITLKQNFFNELKLDKIPQKLQNFEALEFDEFVKEYSKAKKIKFADKLEERNFKNDWSALFEHDKKAVLDLKEQIAKTDKEIDAMVYALYELSEDEIAIVEGR